MIQGNPWWSRIWTVQEAILPSQSTLCWGGLEISWKVLEDAAYNLCHSSRLSPTVMYRIGQLHDLHETFMYPVLGLVISRAGKGPLNVLQRWRYREATEPLDKVYALIGLFQTNPFPRAQSCDYELTAAELYRRVTLDRIDLEENLRPMIGLRGEP
jgi:hypothetical protein